MITLGVPAMLFASSVLMAVAWLAHIRYRERVGFRKALMMSWLLVLPEYVLNISAIRMGHGTYSAGAMASFNLCSGVLCVALVARYLLGEHVTARGICGYLLMAFAVVLVVYE